MLKDHLYKDIFYIKAYDKLLMQNLYQAILMPAPAALDHDHKRENSRGFQGKLKKVRLFRAKK